MTERKREGGRKRSDTGRRWGREGGREGSFRNELLNLKPVNTFQPVKAVIQITVLAASSSLQLLAGMNSLVSPSIHPSIRHSSSELGEHLWQRRGCTTPGKEDGESERLTCSVS